MPVISFAWRTLLGLVLWLTACASVAAGQLETGERGILDRADTLQTQTVYNASRELDALEQAAGLQAVLLVVDGLPAEADGQVSRAADVLFARWQPAGQARERLLVLIDKAGRQLDLRASEGLRQTFPPDVLRQLRESVSGDALAVGDLDATVSDTVARLRRLAAKGGPAAAGTGEAVRGAPMPVERVNGLVAVPALVGPVTDLTATLLPEQAATLATRLLALEAETRAQLAVLLVPTTQPEAIEQYSLRVVEVWKLGQKKLDNGVLLLVSKDDRKMRIEVGYGLEGSLTDATAKRIISEVIAPGFKQGDFFGGIQAGVEAIAQAIKAEPQPVLTAAPPQEAFDIGTTLALFIAMLAGMLLGLALRGRHGKPKAAMIAGVAGSGLGLVLGLFLGGVWLALLAGPLAFLSTFLPSPQISPQRRARQWGVDTSWDVGNTSTPSWGRGGSGGSGRTYSGGGGRFGGGGASGGW